MYIIIINLSIKQKDKVLILDNIDNFSFNKFCMEIYLIIIQFKLTSIPLLLSVLIQLSL
jgi:hypothetical protein